MNMELFNLLTPKQQEEVQEKAYKKIMESFESAEVKPVNLNIDKLTKSILTSALEEFEMNGYSDKVFDMLEKHCEKELKRKLNG